MMKQTQPRMPESFKRGKITPIQVAFIVDQYLCDNNFSETRSTFRNEASSFITNSPNNEVWKSSLSLGEMLDEYLWLKEQKVMMDQQRVVVMQEKNRVQMLLQGMQNVINAFNAFRRSTSSNVAVMNANSAVVPQPRLWVSTITSTVATMQNTSNIRPLPKPINTNVDTGNISTPMITVSDKKRKDTQPVNAPTVAKKRGRPPSRKIPVQGQNTLPPSCNVANNQIVSATQSLAENCIPSGSQVQGSTVAKGSFNQPSFPVPTNLPVPKTPHGTHSFDNDRYVSPTEISWVATCNGEATPSCYTAVSNKRVMVGPAKQMAYIERNRCISPAEANIDEASKRDHIRSRLDYDTSDMPESLDKSLPKEAFESNKEVDMSYIDFSNLEMDCSFSEVLSDLGICCEDVDFFDHPAPTHSKDNA
ncbi:hypothetical protein E2542_SST13265 [Spatholobus suberectus]|nr:hypothetical protein E2542_SST13265 [Spatholobus suberectus]